MLTIHIAENGTATLETGSGYFLTEGVDYQVVHDTMPETLGEQVAQEEATAPTQTEEPDSAALSTAPVAGSHEVAEPQAEPIQ